MAESVIKPTMELVPIYPVGNATNVSSFEGVFYNMNDKIIFGTFGINISDNLSGNSTLLSNLPNITSSNVIPVPVRNNTTGEIYHLKLVRPGELLTNEPLPQASYRGSFVYAT